MNPRTIVYSIKDRLESESGLWQEIVKKKYIKDGCISQIKHRQTDSLVWSDLLKVRDLYLEGRRMRVGDGKSTDVWNDKWCGNFSLREKFQNIYDICHEQKVTELIWQVGDATLPLEDV